MTMLSSSQTRIFATGNEHFKQPKEADECLTEGAKTTFSVPGFKVLRKKRCPESFDAKKFSDLKMVLDADSVVKLNDPKKAIERGCYYRLPLIKVGTVNGQDVVVGTFPQSEKLSISEMNEILDSGSFSGTPVKDPEYKTWKFIMD